MPTELLQEKALGQQTQRSKKLTRPSSLVLRTVLKNHVRTFSWAGRSSKEKSSPCVGIVELKAEDDPDEDVFHALCRRCRNLDFGQYLEGDKTSNYSVQWWRLEDMRTPNCQLCNFVCDRFRTLNCEEVCHYVPQRTCAGASLGASSDKSYQVERFIYFHPELNILPPYDWGMHAITHTVTPIALEVSAANKSAIRTLSADLGLAKHWFDFCRKRHGNACGMLSKGAPFGLKVIDCSNNQICAAPSDCQYIALSYLWGRQSGITTPLPSGPGDSLPKTIADAILVAKQLKIPFLWVDRYCIDQNDEAEKHSMIANMDRIYSGAALTIIAAAGLGPHHGLPGVSTTARNGIIWKFSDYGCYTRMPRVRNEIIMSTWASRGWTYQEMLLSPRRLIFTESQMYFHCCKQEFREAFALPSPHFNTLCANDAEPALPSAQQLGNFLPHYGHQQLSHIFPRNGIGNSATDIYKRIREYSYRQLSYPTDRLNAFDGVFNAFRRSMPGYIHHFWGIPILKSRNYSRMPHDLSSSFCTGLAWELVRMGEGRSNLPPNSRGKDWPSWSWSSVSDRKLSENYGQALKFQRCIEVWLKHNDGLRKNMWSYATGRDDYREYQPWIDVTTWVLEDVELQYAKVELKYSVEEIRLSVNIAHPSITRAASKDFTVYADIDGEDLEGHIIAVYIGTQDLSQYDASRQHYIFAKKNPDGTYRRIGYGKLAIGPAATKRHSKYDKYDKLTWLPGPEQGKSFNAWKHKCVRLV